MTLICACLHLSVRVELALMLPGEAMEPQHVLQLLPGQTEVRVVGVCVGVGSVVTQQDALQQTEDGMRHVKRRLCQMNLNTFSHFLFFFNLEKLYRVDLSALWSVELKNQT